MKPFREATYSALNLVYSRSRHWITAERVTIIVAAAAAGFTGWQTWLTRNSMQVTNRAFVSINDVALTPKGFGDIFHFTPTWVNNGNTNYDKRSSLPKGSRKLG
jgi:hypothetical protein